MKRRLTHSHTVDGQRIAIVRTVVLRPEVLVMKERDIVEEGEAQALFEAPRHAYTQALLAAAHLS